MENLFDTLVYCLNNRQLVALATVIAGPGIGQKLLVWPDGHTLGSLGTVALNTQVALYTSNLFKSHGSGSTLFHENGHDFEIFIEIYPPPPRLIIVGAVHIAIPLVSFAQTLGFTVIVIDARSFFATRERFPHADMLEIGWPPDIMHRLELDVSTYVVILTHDDKFDVPALQTALASPARYIGVLGSQKTQARRIEALKELGLTGETLSRIHSPIGLNLGSVGANEIALSIMAEIIAVKHHLV